MHHAPAGPSLLARAAGSLARVRFRTAHLLAPLLTVIGVLRRMRVLPLALAALTLGAFAVAAPLAPHDDTRGTAALTSTAGDESGLVPATGEGWTQDGAPAAPPPADAGSAPASSASSSASSPASSSPAVAPADEPAPVSDTVSSPASSPADTPAAEPSASSASEEPEEPAAPSPADPEVATTAVDPADEALAAVNEARTSAGCEALTADAGLTSLAAEHSARLSDDDEADAPSSDETWAVATGSDPSAVAGDWLGDEDLLDCGLTSAGVGAVDGFWTLVAA